ncbi:hypothetical protein EDB83DRAFT_2393356 [Lactarius deliciosus]|nr:hypothetical protein EDB83DRAFT_2393356 [Lactarius deliciosus]
MAGLKLVEMRVLGWVYLSLLGIVGHGLGEDRIEGASTSGLSGGHCQWFRVSDVLARLVMEVMGSSRWRKHSERVVALYKHWQWCSAVDLVPTAYHTLQHLPERDRAERSEETVWASHRTGWLTTAWKPCLFGFVTRTLDGLRDGLL